MTARSEALLIGGRSGAGKSSVGYEIHAQLSAADVRHCLIEGDNLDLAHPPPWEHHLAEKNLAAMWANYRALGYRRLVYVNTASVLLEVISDLTAAMGDDPHITAVLLTCSTVTARQRLAQREIGTALAWHIERSDLMARKLGNRAPGWAHRVATDGRAVGGIAAEIIGLAGWAPGGCQDRAGPGAAILGPMPPAAERPITSAAPASQSAHPPGRVTAGQLLLRRMEVEDAGIIAAVVGNSLDHLRPWMPWATRDAADRRTQLARITEADELWESGTDYIYAIFAPGDGGGGSGPPGGGSTTGRSVSGGSAGNRDGTLVGTIGLHRRAAEDVIEIGYWIAAAQIRRGYGTAAARAATSLAAALPGIRQVEIHCDEANVASAAIPRKLGYRLDRTEPHEPEAPGERGRRMIWIWDRGPTRDGAR